MERREFIKRLSAAGLTTGIITGGGSLLSGCAGVTRTAPPGSNRPSNAPAGMNRDRLALLYYAALAPSGHNSQPWRVRIETPDRWVLEADPARRLPAVDPQNRELILSLGAFTENLVLAAGSMGFKVHFKVVTDDPFAQDFIRINLQPSPKSDYPLARLTNRRTLKHGHLPKELTARDLKKLLVPLHRRAVYFPNGSEHARCLQEAAVETFRIQSLRDAAQRELVHWLRLSRADARRLRDGLTVAGMEIPGLKGWFVRNFTEPQDFLKPDFRQQGVDQIAALAGQGAGWIVIISPGLTVADLIETGRRFEQMALLARELNIAIHPMTQALEEQTGQLLIASHHEAEIIPQFLLRVGYCDHYPGPVSLRRPIGAFTYPAPV